MVGVRRDTRFRDIVLALAEGTVSAVPVVEADGRVVGVVSEADLLPKEEFRETSPGPSNCGARPASPGWER
ncbi:CBS domain-containing protein [Streptomyces sp. NPDC101152]|uniref:CBS domain-containing protein n=1 Tax=Streptomyces sp. NPDC101152 TaxID=3366116 RepID=UPI0037F90C9B